MATWAETLKDYRLVEWNETSFDVASVPYVKEAYDAGKFAFVSDYVRLHALFREGGIYLDTDVDVRKPFDDLLEQEAFWGFEYGDYIATSTIGARPGNALIGAFLASYETKRFVRDDGTFDSLTNVAVVTDMMERAGLRRDGAFQRIEGVGAVYPQEYFSPYDYANCRMLTSERTYTVHRFDKSWLPASARRKAAAKSLLAKAVGGETIYRMRKLFGGGGHLG